MHEKYAFVLSNPLFFNTRTTVINFQKLTADPHYITSVSATTFVIRVVSIPHLLNTDNFTHVVGEKLKVVD